jgi:hypothetical protein
MSLALSQLVPQSHRARLRSWLEKALICACRRSFEKRQWRETSWISVLGSAKGAKCESQGIAPGRSVPTF